MSEQFQQWKEEDFRAVGSLLHWGLQPHARPVVEIDYRQLLARYEDELSFRLAVNEFATGLGLRIVEAHRTMGLVLAPLPNSVFTTRIPDSMQSDTETRLITGLILVAIVATVFPLAQDLDDPHIKVRDLISVDIVERTLRELGEAIEVERRDDPDPVLRKLGTQREVLREAWRILKAQPSVHETRSGRKSTRSLQTRIERMLEWLQGECGYLSRVSNREGILSFRPTWRFQSLVQDYGADAFYDSVCSGLSAVPPTDAENF